MSTGLHCIALNCIATLHFIAGVEYKAKVREERDVDGLTLYCIALNCLHYNALQELSTRCRKEEGGVDRPTLEPILTSA